MQLAPGARLAHYEIVAAIGKGGMGEVWRAKDTKLGRDVAIKVLPDEFTMDPERLARFEREARVLASLNHPHIASIHEIGESVIPTSEAARGLLTADSSPAARNDAGGPARDGRTLCYLVMELAEGEDLSVRLQRGPVPVEEAIPIAGQIADALEAAHEKGIIHRDLKPANVKISDDGQVKLLDFGLAKALDVEEGDPELSNSPTMVKAATHAGMILGTAAYMSPEQARGKKVDKRADIWAFGVVLYEMLSGTRLFSGETVSDTLAAVLTKDVDLASLPPRLPDSIRTLIGHCLERDSRRRLRDIGDARLELEETLAGRTASGSVRVASEMPKATRRATGLRMLGALLLGIILGGLPVAWFVTRRQPAGPASGVVSLDLNFPADVRFDYYLVSPDGSRIAAQGRPRVAPGLPEPLSRVYVQRLEGGTMAPVPGTEGARAFLISPDGKWLLFTAPITPGAPQSNLVRVPIDGSAPPFTICAWDPKWTSFAILSSGDYIALSEGTSTVRIPANGGAPSAPAKIDMSNVRGNLSIGSRPIPGDRGLLVQSISYGARGWYYQIGLLDLKTSRIRFLIDDGGNPVYSPTGHLVFSRGGALLAVPFDPESMTVTGSPTPITDGLQTRFAFEPAPFDLSDKGVLVYSRGGRTAESRRIGLVDSSGNLKPISDERRVYQSLNGAGEDGKRFVATITNGQGIDELWVGELARPGLRRIVAISDADIFTPILSKDGRRVAFGRHGKNDDDGVYVKDPDSASPPVRVVRVPADERRIVLLAWTPDGSTLIASRAGVDGKSDIVRAVLPAVSGKLAEFEPIVASPANESWAALSPDGRLLAWVSDESGRDEVYIGSFDPSGRVGNGLQVTKSGGRFVYWARDGRRIQYTDLSAQVFSLPVSTSPSLVPGTPTLVYDGRKLNVFGSDVLPDGRQLVIIRGEDESDEARNCAVVLNWTRELLAKTRNSK